MAKQQIDLNTVGGFFTQLKILHGALCMGVFLFLGISVFLVNSGSVGDSFDPDQSQLFLYLALGLSIACLFVSRFIGPKILEGAKTKNTLDEKIEVYRSASIVNYALIEGPSLACITFFLLSGNYYILGLGIVNLLLLASLHPTKTKATIALELAGDHRRDIQLDSTKIIRSSTNNR